MTVATLILPASGAVVDVVDKEQAERFVAAGWVRKAAEKPAAKSPAAKTEK